MIKNQLKTVVLLGLLTGVLLWVGNLMGGMRGLTFALFFAILLNFGSYWFSDKIVLRMYRAKEVNEESAHRLFKLVKEVSHLANIPMPKVYIIPTDNSNAFATGRDPKHAAVACTAGILKLMNDEELKGVIAHEVSHIKNRDTLIQAVAATITGVIAYVAMIARWGAIFGGFGGRDRRGGSGLELLMLAIVTPIIAAIIQLAISRSREYIADESAAKTLHNSYGLADALEKLEHDAARHPMRFGSPSTAHLFIANPFSGRGMMKLLSTHPPLQERVKKLRGMRV
tara:strand:- start:19941 stop:20792 length:852 start_codon:yes stop_codon:yes gene_type:complete